MVSRGMMHWSTVGIALLVVLLHGPGQAQTGAELQEKYQQLEAELQRLKTEYDMVLGLTGPAKKEILAMAAVLAAKPGMAFDFSAQSGEMCFAPGRGDMMHYAVDPGKTTEDIVYMLNAQPFIANGLQVSKLPRLPVEKEKMEPFQWYYYDGTTVEPHHGRQWNRPYLYMSVNVR